MKKKILALGLSVFMMGAMLAGCSQPPTDNAPTTDDSASGEATSEVKPSGEDLVIGMAFQDMNNPYFITMHEAFEEAAASIGAKAIVTDARHDVGKQTNDVDDLIQQGVDILLLNPADSVGIESAVIAAKDAGIIVVAIDAQANGPLDSFVGSKNYDAGYLAGEKMAEDLGGEGKVAILDGIPVVPILERVRGFEAAIAEHPGIEIVDVQNGQQERSIAMDVTENMLQSNADLDAIFSVNDGGALGTLAAVEASNRDVWIYSVDGHPEVIEAILEGGVFKATTAQYPRDQVRVGLGMALAKLWGAEVVPTEVPIDVQLQTIDNAADFSW